MFYVNFGECWMMCVLKNRFETWENNNFFVLIVIIEIKFVMGQMKIDYYNLNIYVIQSMYIYNIIYTIYYIYNTMYILYIQSMYQWWVVSFSRGHVFEKKKNQNRFFSFKFYSAIFFL